MDLALALGLEVKVNKVTLKPITLEEIANISESKYEAYKRLISINIDNLLDEKQIDALKEMNINIDELRVLDVLTQILNIDLDFKDSFMKAINFFIKEKIEINSNVLCFKDKNNEIQIISSEDFEEIRKGIFRLHKIEEEERVVAGNKLTAEFQKELALRRKLIEKYIKKIGLSDYIIALISLGMKIEDIKKLTIYQFFAIIEQSKHLRENEFINFGIMNGNVDVKKLKDKKILDMVIKTVK